MARNSLAMHILYVKKSRGGVGHVELGNVNGVDFYDITEGFCRWLKNKGMQSDDEIKRSFSVERFAFSPDERWIYGRLFKGDYGTKREVFDRRTGAKNGELSEDDVVPEPYYFGFYIPREQTRGFLLLQRIGAVGVLGDFRREMKGNINKTVIPGYQFDLAPAVSNSVINELYRTGRVSQIVLTQFTTSTDVFDGVDGMRAMEIKAQLLLKPTERGAALPLNEALAQTRERGRVVSDIIGIKNINFDYDEATVEIYGLGKQWTVDLEDFSKMNPYYVIDEDVELDERGYPSFEGVHTFAKKLVEAHLEGETEGLMGDAQ